MNNLSWFLYAVDIVHSLGIVLFIVLITLFLATGVYAIGEGTDLADSSRTTDEDWKQFRKRLSQLSITTGLILVLAVLTPSKRTMYLILGSEVGEEMVQSETMQKVKRAIDMKLEEYLLEDIPKNKPRE